MASGAPPWWPPAQGATKPKESATCPGRPLSHPGAELRKRLQIPVKKLTTFCTVTSSYQNLITARIRIIFIRELFTRQRKGS